ncbi:rCG55640 [Rattus norvegicus]|uniref:RCG55640 n=1 Tax=Rattus norvegicus TaxID=10116 RepID=A6JR58_RAT|nr:rCG55640 [Rattus norvegicus]
MRELFVQLLPKPQSLESWLKCFWTQGISEVGPQRGKKVSHGLFFHQGWHCLSECY